MFFFELLKHFLAKLKFELLELFNPLLPSVTHHIEIKGNDSNKGT